MTLCLQWNLNGYYKRLAELQQLITRYNPIVIALQETHLHKQSSTPSNQYSIFRYDHFNPQHANGGTAVMVQKNYRAEKIKSTSVLQNVAVQVHIPVLNSTITFCSIYIPPNQTIKSQDLTDLTLTLPKPLILCGDFNAHSFTWDSRRTNSRGNAVDHFLNHSLDLLLLNARHTPTHINSTYGSLSTIDLSICSSALYSKLTWSAHPDLCDSDHFPIIISNIKVTPQRIRSPARWLIQKANWSLFQDLTAETSHLPLVTTSIPEAIKSITNLITDAALQAIPESATKSISHKVPWWSENIKIALKARNKALNRYRKSRLPADFVQYKKLRAKARVLIRFSKKQSWNDFVSSINKPVSCSTMWSNIKRISGTKKSFTITSLQVNDQNISSSSDIAETLADHFAAVSSDHNYDPTFLTRKKQSEKNPLDFSTKMTDLPYNQPISETEITATIHQCFKNSAPGLDRIVPAMLKQLHPNAIKYITSLFNEILRSGSYPTNWKTAIVIPILKPHSDASTPKSYRPISLTSVLGKTFEKIINKRLTWYLEANNQLSLSQYGFRRFRSTTIALADLESQIQDAFTKKEQLYSIFFDMEKAFDRVWQYHMYMHHAPQIRTTRIPSPHLAVLSPEPIHPSSNRRPSLCP